MTDQIIAVDLGGTQARAALCDAEGKILDRYAQSANAVAGVEAVYTSVVETIRRVATDLAQIRGIGVGVPGPVGPWQGIIHEAPNLAGMVDFPIKARLEKDFGIPTFVGNDANLAAMGEHRFGAGRGVSHMIYITISTGIGGGIIVDDQLLLGWRGFAGEVGHQTLDANGPLCNCGNIGCLEVLAAGPAIERTAREALRAGRESKMNAMVGGDVERVTGAIISRAALEGDPLAKGIYERAAFYIGLGLVSLLHNFDTQVFVIGGGVAIHAWDLIYPTMSQVLVKHAFPSMSKGVRIVPAQLGDDVVLLGAAALVNEKLQMSK
ncbi:MAG: ROK family protein [Chloroflexi bacterium]|nr:ROK family protein [Chloroflexota bacterium]